MCEQTRVLRVRSFVNFLRTHPGDGAYFQIGADPKDKLSIYRNPNRVIAEAVSGDTWLADVDVRRSAAYATTLFRMREVDFDSLERHVYETAKSNLVLFHATAVFAESRDNTVSDRRRPRPYSCPNGSGINFCLGRRSG
jgi:hypothetical protein